MFVLGLTGSIGMGKSVTAGLFRDSGMPIFDADAAVRALYAGPAAPLIEAAFPGTVHGGIVDREALGRQVLEDDAAMQRLEALVHPMVRAEREAFLLTARRALAGMAVLDIPLLFETGGEDLVDAILVVSASEREQAARVLARPGMTAEKLANIRARQIPDAEKRRRAHFVIDTGQGIDYARRQVSGLLRCLAGPAAGRR